MVDFTPKSWWCGVCRLFQLESWLVLTDITLPQMSIRFVSPLVPYGLHVLWILSKPAETPCWSREGRSFDLTTSALTFGTIGSKGNFFRTFEPRLLPWIRCFVHKVLHYSCFPCSRWRKCTFWRGSEIMFNRTDDGGFIWVYRFVLPYNNILWLYLLFIILLLLGLIV